MNYRGQKLKVEMQRFGTAYRIHDVSILVYATPVLTAAKTNPKPLASALRQPLPQLCSLAGRISTPPPWLASTRFT